MKPYNIEIFDRQFNFLYTALIDESDFSYKFDAVSPEKNTLTLPTSFKPSELLNEPRAPKGWYVRITRDSEEYQGVITGFEEGDIQNVITYSQLITLFDCEIPIAAQEITTTTIELYISRVLTNTFINNSDTVQDIYGLSITYSGATTGSLAYCNVDTTYTAINILNDLLYAAYTTYGIYTDVKADFGTKHINVNIGILTESSMMIEGDLPNVIENNYVIKKQQGSEVNKVIIRDTYFGVDYFYYLYSDGSFGTDANPTGKTRIFPTVTSVLLIDRYELAKGLVDAKYNEYINVIAQYSLYNGTIPNNVWSLFATAVSNLGGKYRNLIGVESYRFNFNQYALWVESAEEWLICNFRQDDVDRFGGAITYSQSSAYYRTFGSNNDNIMWGNYYDTQYNYYGHAALDVEGVVVGAYTREGREPEDVEEYQHNYVMFGETLAKNAFAAYQKTAEYSQEIINKSSSQEILNILTNKAKAEFAANKYSNLIELTVKADDMMINPMDLEIGQVVNIIHEGVSYNSILSGKEIKGGLVKLIFGTIRLELTKILNMKGV